MIALLLKKGGENKYMAITHKDEKTANGKSMHPGVAAAIGAVVGAAGGAAVAMAYKNPDVQKKAKEQFDILSKKATDAWNKMGEQPAGKQLSSKAQEQISGFKDKAGDFMNDKKTEKKSIKTDLK